MTDDRLVFRRKRLLFRRVRRGTKESDRIIGGFAQAWLPRLDEQQLDQLTDALKVLAGKGELRGGLFHGRRYDTGNKLDYLRTMVMFAAERPDLASEFVPWLRKYLEGLA